MAIKLKIGNEVAFDVLFSIVDGKGASVDYGFRAAAERAGDPEPEDTFGNYLATRAKVRMLAWTGDVSPFCDEAGVDTPPGPEALAALYDAVPNTPGLIYTAFKQAISGKARLGN